jgi:hypothetical protein
LRRRGLRECDGCEENACNRERGCAPDGKVSAHMQDRGSERMSVTDGFGHAIRHAPRAQLLRQRD